MISIIEDEFYKIIQPIIQKSDLSNNSDNFIINIDQILIRDKINLINNIKIFIKNNLINPSLSILFSKHLSIIFSEILFKGLDDRDQNVRIVSDESINFIIRLTSNQYSPYIIYNLFLQLKNNYSPRSINGALHKFSNLSYLIKHSKRQSYINNVLPVLKVLINRSEESILLTLVESMPKIAENLFQFSNDADIVTSLILPILRNLRETEIVSLQRNFGQLLSIICLHLKDPKFYLKKFFQYCVSINYDKENEVTYTLLLIKSLLTICYDFLNVDEIIFVLIRIIETIERDSSPASKNLALDCLLQLLRLKNCPILLDFIMATNHDIDIYQKNIKLLNHELIFPLEDLENDQNVVDITELTDVVTIEEEDTLFIRYQSNESFEVFNDDNDDQLINIDDTTFINATTIQNEESDVINNDVVIEEKINEGIQLGTFVDWEYTIIKYIVELMILQFLPDCIDDLSSLSFLKKRNIRVNSKVLAINCLTQICSIDYGVIITQLPVIIKAPCILPSALDSVLFYCNDDDSQLGGSAILFVGQVISSQLSLNTESSPGAPHVDHVPLIMRIQGLLDNPISSQHLKFVLSAVRLFLWEMVSTNQGSLGINIIKTVLHFADHNYKLVRREVISVCRCIDFRSIACLEQTRKTSGFLKNVTVAELCIPVILSLLSDVELDVVEDACVAIKDLIENGAFGDHYGCEDSCHMVSTNDSATYIDSPINQTKLIPFLSSDINISLLDVRNKQRELSTNSHDGIHRCLHMVAEKLISTPVPSGKEMKVALNNINGCISVIIMLLEKFPLNNYPHLWIVQSNKSNPNYTYTTTRHLLSHCLSLLNVPFIIMHMHLHSNILHVTSRLILHGGLEHLLANNLLIEKTSSTSGIVLHLNVDLPLVASLKLLMIHVSRMLNIFWHVFQFIIPVIPPHKTVIPNLSSQTSMNPPKKKTDPIIYNKGSTNTDNLSSLDNRPPRSRSCLGFFVHSSHYMAMYKSLTVAYNSYLISSDSSNYSDKLLCLLSKCLESMSIILEIISFNEVCPYVEEFLAYCSVFYYVLPAQTINFIIKLLGSLFGTNLTAQWDPFISQVFSLIIKERPENDPVHDISQLSIKQWSRFTNMIGTRLQERLKNASIDIHSIDSLDIEKWGESLSDTFQWIKSSGKRREPGILRQMVSTNVNSRPSLSHYIGMFEKHVFQCMRQYLASPPELQSTIMQLLCQLIYLRVNYCQLDSEQKFLNIIFNQLETFSAGNDNLENKSFLILEIMEFLILITYEKAGPTKRNQPILSITHVIHLVESLLLNGINVQSVIIPCLWKIICDLFVHRSVWLNHPGNFNLFPNANTSKEIGVQREAVLDLILRKLLTYPNSLDLLSIILEHSAREHEQKWETISLQVWSKVSLMLSKNGIDFSEPSHVDSLLRLLGFISVKAISNQSFNNIIMDMVLENEHCSLKEDLHSSTIASKYQEHIIASIRSVVSLHIITLYKLDLSLTYTKLYSKVIDDYTSRKTLINKMVDILHSLIHSYYVVTNTSHVVVKEGYVKTGVKLLRTLLLIILEVIKSNNSWNQNQLNKEELSELVHINSLSNMERYFRQVKDSELDILKLWDELKYQCGLYQCSSSMSKSRSLQYMFSCNNVFQICRHLAEMDSHGRDGFIQDFISQYYTLIIKLSNESYVIRILDIIMVNEGLSVHFLETFKKNCDEIIKIISLSMKWLSIIERLHPSCSKVILDILQHFVSNHEAISSVVLMKMDVILCARFVVISVLDCERELPNVLLEVISLEKMMLERRLSFPQLSVKLLKYKQNLPKSTLITSLEMDPLHSIEVVDVMDEKKFWKLCVEKSLINHEQDVRLGPRLLQGGTVKDLEEIFQVILVSAETKVLENVGLDVKSDSSILSNLPPKFIQQCLRLGFLRSGGGGIMQEGIRVDIIFRLGEKLMFQELSHVVEVTKICLMKEDYSILEKSNLRGLLAALSDYLSLSCQLSVPMPVSTVDINHLVQLIEDLCLLIIKSKNICSRLLIEEVLVLMTSCFCPSTILTNEEMKPLGRDLPWSYVTVIVDFLYMVVDKYTQNNGIECAITSSFKEASRDINTYTLVKVYMIVQLCLQDVLAGNGNNLQRRLKWAIWTIVRLPSIVKFIRNPNNIKSVDVLKVESINKYSNSKDIVELDCLSKMNRDDLTSAQTLFSNIGWCSKFMFEETWLLYLNLLHDKGPSFTITGTDERDVPLTSEEVVEQGHCDSLGLLGVTNLLLRTTARPCPGNPNNTQLEHRPRDKTPNLLHTKIGKKLSIIHGQLDDEIFSSHRGFKMMLSGWTVSSWNIEREDSILQYRHDQINVNVLAKRISIGSQSPQISGADNNNLDVLSCLHSLPIIYGQWLQVESFEENKKSAALWPRACALRSSIILMDLFSSREQVQWLFDSLLELHKSINIEDDWITLSWLAIGLSKCVAVLETSSNVTMPQTTVKSQAHILTASIYGLLPTIKMIESCLNSDLTILQQSALHSAMFLLQMTIYGKASWDLPPGSLLELRGLHEMVMAYLEEQLLSIDPPTVRTTRRNSFSDTSNSSNSLSQAMSTGAATFANTVSGLTSMNTQMSFTTNVNNSSNVHSLTSSLPRLMKGLRGLYIRSERHNHLVMAAACFYCEIYPETLKESDLLNNFVTLAKNVMQTDKVIYMSATSILVLCRCLERCFLTQRVSILVIEQVIRICSHYLKTCKSTTYSLPVLRLFLTSCYLSLANSLQSNPTAGVVESVFYNGLSNSNGENMLVMLERVNVFWKRLTDADVIDVVESRILSRLISNIMTEFMSGEEVLNKTIHQLLRSWPKAQYVAKTLFDIITRCLNQTDGEKLIRKWTLMVLPSLTSCRPVNLSLWVTTIVLVASSSSSRVALRAIFSQCLDWLTNFEIGDGYICEMETCLFISSFAFIKDLSRDINTEVENKAAFLKAIHSNIDIPSFQKLYSLCVKKKLM